MGPVHTMCMARARGTGHRATEPLVELWKGPHLSRATPRASGRVLVRDESGQALVDVRNEARLAHLAVVDDVQAEHGLLADDLAHRGPHSGRVAILIVRSAAGFRLDHLEQVAGAGQAPGVGRENPIAATLHAGLTCS